MNIVKLLRRAVSPPLVLAAQAYLLRVRYYSYRGIRVRVSPGVFHPGLFFSTKLLLEHALGYELQGKRVLELGAGSGLISLCAAQQGAIVTATDIAAAAIADLHTNAELNRLPITIVRSDLFSELSGCQYDLILINPPYYPRDPESESDRAWRCGSDFGYFRKLFLALSGRGIGAARVLMILSDACAVETITGIAAASGLAVAPIVTMNTWLETNTIYAISSNSGNSSQHS